jgi:hypothetical protein
MGEDGGLFAVGQICNDEAIAGERPKVEDVGADLYAGDEQIGVRVEIGSVHNNPERAASRSMWPRPAQGSRIGPSTWTARQSARMIPSASEGDVSVALEALKAA